MRKQDFFKRAAVLALAGALAMGNAMTSFAAGWQWLDENNDGIAECYYFDEGGHKLTGTTTPDGYKVNADGAWVENGAVQTQASSSPAGSGVASGQTGAAGWHHDGIGWRYRRFTGNDASAIWVWSDRNNDGTSELYYFQYGYQDGKFGGYLLTNGVSPEGYTVNEEGARMVNGVVLTQPAAPVYAPENTYNAQGVSNIALEMVENTREENAKFGEMEVFGENSNEIHVMYANGFTIDYPNMGGGMKSLRPTSKDGELLFKYYKSSLSSGDAIESYLYGLGLGFKGGYGGTYSTGTGCWINFDEGHDMTWSGDGFIEIRAMQQ